MTTINLRIQDMSSPSKKGLERPDDEAIVTEICDYAEKYEIKEMLQEYMRRLIVEQPKEPLKFLVKEITENPYKLSTADPEEAVSEPTTVSS